MNDTPNEILNRAPKNIYNSQRSNIKPRSKNKNKIGRFSNIKPLLPIINNPILPKIASSPSYRSVPANKITETPISTRRSSIDNCQDIKIETDIKESNKVLKIVLDPSQMDNSINPDNLIIDEPVIINEPIIIEELITVETPTIIGEPIIIEEPTRIDEYVKVDESINEESISVGEPIVMEPINIEEPTIVLQPIRVGEPIIVEQPIRVEEPIRVE